MDPTRLKTTIRKVHNLSDPSKPWSLCWQTPIMPAPAFWYFDTEQDAQAAEEDIRRLRGASRHAQYEGQHEVPDTALINVTARPRVIIITPEHVQIQDPAYLSLCRPASQVIIRVDLHDEYFIRTKRAWRARLRDAHPDKVQTASAKHRAHQRFMRLAEDYMDWLQGERVWYAVVKLPLPR